MKDIMWIILTLCAAYTVGRVFKKLHIPGAMMLGGMIGAAALNVVTDRAAAPYVFRFFSQAIAGGFLGAYVDKQRIRQIPRLALPLGLIMLGLFISDFVIGILIHACSPVDTLTAFCAGIAGGINDVPMIAADMGADAGKVAVLQFVRLLTGILLIPGLIKVLDKDERDAVQTLAVSEERKQIPIEKTLMAAAIALAGGYAGKCLRFAGGILLFSMLTVALLHLTTGLGEMSPKIKTVAMLLAGTYIGCLLDKDDILELRYLLIPAIILAVTFVVNCLLTGKMLQKLWKMTVRESMLACSPAGASEISLLSADLGLDAPQAADIMLLHIFRVILAVSVTPRLILLFVHFVG